MGTYPPFGDNLEGELSEEDGVDQRAEPPSWLPGALPRTGTSADLRSPEAEEAATGTSDTGSRYTFTGESSYPSGPGAAGEVDGEDTYAPDSTYSPGAVASGYSYQEDDASPGETTAQVPVYPGAAVSGTTADGAAAPPAPEQADTGNSADSEAKTAAFSVAPRRRYFGGGGAAPGDPAASPDDAAPGAGAASPAGATAGAAAPAVALPGTSGRQAAASPAQARRAELVVARLEPWSVMKFSFLMSLVAWVVLFVAVALLYFVLSGLGVFSSIQHTLTSVTSSTSSSGMKLSAWFSASRVLGYTMLLGAVNIVLITALSTVGAMIYNLVTHLGGGIEVTLRETD
jgi:Transmembrane domain of unknown function (DUF3566)